MGDDASELGPVGVGDHQGGVIQTLSPDLPLEPQVLGQEPAEVEKQLHVERRLDQGLLEVFQRRNRLLQHRLRWIEPRFVD